MTNSADPDQLKKPTDLDLHCFQRQGIRVHQDKGKFSRKPSSYFISIPAFDPFGTPYKILRWLRKSDLIIL